MLVNKLELDLELNNANVSHFGLFVGKVALVQVMAYFLVIKALPEPMLIYLQGDFNRGACLNDF